MSNSNEKRKQWKKEENELHRKVDVRMEKIRQLANDACNRNDEALRKMDSRIEEIKQKVLANCGVIEIKDFDWLIEQVEKWQKLKQILVDSKNYDALWHMKDIEDEKM